MEAINLEENIRSLELRNKQGASVRILNLGARITELNIPSHEQGLINTVLGYPHPHSYLNDSAFHGAITGRFSNRIANSSFELGGKTWQLPANEGPHHLHGGPGGFSNRLWQVEHCERNSATLSLHSAHGDQGYPGGARILLCYTLDETNGLDISWQAESDRDTVIGLSSHCYFNLAGYGDIRSHRVRIAAGSFTPASADLIPTGDIQSVTGSVLDLRQFSCIGSILDSDDPLIEVQGGLDHNWARGNSGELELSAELFCSTTGLLLQVRSTLPGLQCYTGNHLAAAGIHGTHEGVCLEPQYYPDSPNQPGFPPALLQAGHTTHHQIQYQFTALEPGEEPAP